MSAVERAAKAIAYEYGEDYDIGHEVEARAVLTAALTDSDDPDWLARTLFGLHSYGIGGLPEDEDVIAAWNVHGERSHDHWRAVADGLRATILGEA
jgi:hypothetical protein